MYDAIVVGAGPAGATAAKLLANAQRSVLLVECKKLPRYKSCSGVLIGRTVQLVREHFASDVPTQVTCTPIVSKGMVFVDDMGREQRFDQDGLNVWRSDFDGWLTVRAQEAGGQVRDCTRAITVRDCGDHAEVLLHSPGQGSQWEQARHVIVCDGGAGTLRTKLSGAPLERVLTYQTYHRGSLGIDPAYFYAYLQREFSTYDAWLNVKDGLIITGVAVLNPAEAPTYHKRFQEFLQQETGFCNESTLAVDRWVMPRVQPGCRLALGQGRVLYCGEAAGFLNPMGEGISMAMDSGARAAQSILACLNDPQGALEAYRKSTRFLQAHMQRQWHGVAQMASTFAAMAMAW